MVSSLNKTIALSIKATSFNHITSYGDVLIGDKAFEYYNERNPLDFIQIPWTEITLVKASVLFNKHIPRFAIYTRANGSFIFSTRDNKATLRHIREYVGEDKLRRTQSLSNQIKTQIKQIFKH